MKIPRKTSYNKGHKKGNVQARDYQREMILQQVSDMYLQGKTQWEIANSFVPRLTQATVSLRLTEVKNRWKESALISFDEKKQKELARIDLLEAECYKAWFRSQKNVKVRKVVQRALRKAEEQEDTKTLVIVGKINEQLSETAAGEAKYLQQIHRCIELRCQILGFTKPADIKVQNNNTVNVTSGWDELYKPVPVVDAATELIQARLQLPVHVEDSKNGKPKVESGKRTGD